MPELLAILTDPDLTFFRNALLTGLLASISFGVIGSYVVVRRISAIAGAIAHCVLGGIGAGLYLERALGIGWAGPMSGAIVVALLAAIILTLVSLRGGQREDTVIAVLWSLGMAIGLLFLAKTPGYVDPMSYLFGNILLISATDLKVQAGLALLVLGVTWLCHSSFLALCFDEEYARLRGVRTGWYYLLLLCLTALTTVLLLRVVGIVLVIALLTLPAAAAGNLARSIGQMMWLATLFCMVCVVVGLGLSYHLDLPGGPVIILVAGGLYLASLTGRRLKA